MADTGGLAVAQQAPSKPDAQHGHADEENEEHQQGEHAEAQQAHGDAGEGMAWLRGAKAACRRLESKRNAWTGIAWRRDRMRPMTVPAVSGLGEASCEKFVKSRAGT